METAIIEFGNNGDQVPGYLAQPDGDGPFPAVVVIQEWWGLNSHIKDEGAAHFGLALAVCGVIAITD